MNYETEAQKQIADPFAYRWRAHGLGMLRTYLDAEETVRLNLWHHRLVTPDVSLMHTHPWTLRSTILYGRLHNTRWERVKETWVGGQAFIEDKVPCGVRANHEFALAGKPEKVWLRPKAVEVYEPGQFYSQAPDEIHTTDFLDGTATLMTRGRERTDGEEASVFWPVGDEWGDATRDLTTEDIVETISAVRRQMP